jgi:hypothetical protein
LCKNREYGSEIRNFFGAKIEIIFETTKNKLKKLRRRGRIDASSLHGLSTPSLSGGPSRGEGSIFDLFHAIRDLITGLIKGEATEQQFLTVFGIAHFVFINHIGFIVFLFNLILQFFKVFMI